MMGVVGDRDRVEVVYRSVYRRLWRSLLAYTGDAELASDAAAEAFAQVLRRGDAVDDVGAWVWRSAFRIASGLLMTKSSGADAVCGDGLALVPASVTEFIDLLRELSPQQRACVALRYVGGYTSSEIGEVLGTSASTVRVHLTRAHAVLRQTIAEAEHA